MSMALKYLFRTAMGKIGNGYRIGNLFQTLGVVRLTAMFSLSYSFPRESMEAQSTGQLEN